MDPLYINGVLAEICVALNYVIVILLVQISVFFIKQWNDERKKELKNLIILSYGVYFLFLMIGNAIYFITNDLSIFDFSVYYILSVIISGIGGIMFSIAMEFKFQEKIRTKYIISLSFGLVLITTLFLVNTPGFIPMVSISGLFLLSLPIIFNIYFIRQTSDEYRRKMRITLIGFIVICIGLTFSSFYILELITSFYIFPYLIIFPLKMIIIFGMFLLFYGFYGHSFYLELEWRDNLISLHIIDKTRKIAVYHKSFLEEEVFSEEVFVGGIIGINKIIIEVTESDKKVGVINLKEKLILLADGEKIMTALVVKKNLQNAYFILKEISKKFEIFFGDYLKDSESYDSSRTQSEISRPMEMLIRDIINW